MLKSGLPPYQKAGCRLQRQAAQKSLLMAADHDEKAILGGLQQVLLLLSCYQPLRVMCPGRTHRDSSAVCMHKCVHAQICKNAQICQKNGFVSMFCLYLCSCQLNTRCTVGASFCQFHICRIVFWQASQSCISPGARCTNFDIPQPANN